uniref:Uncharacterized protein n=1 Tax=Alexandrium monilatum TaxID=311494 RepID=A0A7S4V0Z3_9DINO
MGLPAPALSISVQRTYKLLPYFYPLLQPMALLRITRRRTSENKAARKTAALYAAVFMSSVIAGEGSAAVPPMATTQRDLRLASVDASSALQTEDLRLASVDASSALQTEDLRSAPVDASSALQTEVMVRSASYTAGPGSAAHLEHDMPEQAPCNAVMRLLNTLIFIAAAHGLKQWGQPVVDGFLGSLAKQSPDKAGRAQEDETEDLTVNAAAEPICPAYDNHHDAGESAQRASACATVRDDSTDVSAFLIAWDCFR